MTSAFLAVILIPLGILAIIAIWCIGLYNSLVALRNRYENAFAQIDVQLKRRYDLIPNLVETAKGYMRHEKETLQAVIEARNSAFQAEQNVMNNVGDPDAMKQFNRAEGQLGGALGRLLAIAESYPDLKANENMLALQEELTSTENKVSFARQSYNDSVTNYNTRREQFPAVFIANTFGFRDAELFEIENEKVRETPKVQF